MIRYAVSHATTYAYAEPVEICQSVAWLTPRDTPRQRVQDVRIDISPPPDVLTHRRDYFGNVVTFFHLQELHEQVKIVARSTIEIDGPRDAPAADLPWEQARDQLDADRSPAGIDARQFRFDSRFVRTASALRDYAATSFAPGRPLREALLDLTRRIYREFRYDPKSTTIATPIEKVFADRAGVCQDFAHLQIAMLRSLGLASRYVSGYLDNQPPPGKKQLVGADASHAWLSVFVPGHGWLDADPTNNQLPGDRHVTVAWGRDYADVTPLRGVILGGGAHKLTVAVDVQRL